MRSPHRVRISTCVAIQKLAPIIRCTLLLSSFRQFGLSIAAAVPDVVAGTTERCDDRIRPNFLGRSISKLLTEETSCMIADLHGSDLGVSQNLPPEYESCILARMEQARLYMDLLQSNTFLRRKCLNRDSFCALWAVQGECDENPGFMRVQCAPVCFSCHQLDVQIRCAIDNSQRVVLKEAGDLDRLFASIVNNPMNQIYQPVVLSRPDGALDQASPHNSGFWMIRFDKAVTKEEADHLVQWGHRLGYKQSTDLRLQDLRLVKDKSQPIVHGGRTSTNTFCTDACWSDPIVQSVVQRMSNITGIPIFNQERLQLLRYQSGQFYHPHLDYIPYQIDRPCGVRILTLYLYLSDVLEGGGTEFPHLNLTVTPLKGRALLWPNVLSQAPNQPDPRSLHEALPVVQGLKYGANSWIHQGDYQEARKWACT